MDITAMTEQELEALCISWRRWFHAHPEVSLHEQHTAEKIYGILEELGLHPVRGQGHYGLAATIEGGQPGGMVALRADMDALSVTEETGLPFASENPGVMHACGHDTHMTILLETILRLLQRRQEIKGRVRLLFQPSEELSPHGGAPFMMKDGFLDGVQGVFGLHVWPNIPLGKIGIKPGALMAASDRLKIEILGRSAHAGHPQEGIDAIMAAVNFLQQLNQIISRRISPLSTATINIGTFQGGERYNVVPGKVTLEGTVRNLDEDNRIHIKEFIGNLLEGLKVSTGIDYTYDYQFGHPVVMNWPVPTALVQKTATRVLGQDGLMPHISPDLIAEDFGKYLKKYPGAFLWLGCRAAGTPFYGLHNAKFCPDESVLVIGSRLMSQVAIDALEALAQGTDFSAEEAKEG